MGHVLNANCIRCGRVFARSERGRVCPSCLVQPGGVAVLSLRERQVVDAISRGCGNKEIAAALYISERTVKAHVASVFKKLRVNTRLQAALTWLKELQRTAA